jgi:hypothetical protein
MANREPNPVKCEKCGDLIANVDFGNGEIIQVGHKEDCVDYRKKIKDDKETNS